MTTRRFVELDGLRGLAALSVVLLPEQGLVASLQHSPSVFFGMVGLPSLYLLCLAALS